MLTVVSQGDTDYIENNTRDLRCSQNVSWTLKWNLKWWIVTDQVNRKAMKFPFKEANVQEVWSHKEVDVRRKLQVDHWMQLKNEQTGECAKIKQKTARKNTESAMW